MHKARAFFFVCAGILCLALAYHLGARSATAQAPANPVVGVAGGGTHLWFAMTAGGDSYFTPNDGQTWYRYANCFGAATPATQETWGGVKSRYRPGASATPQDK